MEGTIGQRIKALRAFYKLSIPDFANLCGVSAIAIHHFENGETLRLQDNYLTGIARVSGTTVSWLLTGQGDMLPDGPKELHNVSAGHPEQNTLYLEMKRKNKLLEKELEHLWQIIQYLADKKV